MVYLALKNNTLGRFSDQFRKMGDAFLKGDDQAFMEASKEHEEAPLHIVEDAVPVFAAVSAVREAADKAGEGLKRMVASVKRKAERFVGGAREAAVDARVALTGLGGDGGGLAREIFDPEPLPEVKAFSRRQPVPASPWDAKGPLTVASASRWDAQRPAAAKTDPWAKSAWDPPSAPKGKPASPAKPSSFRKWAEAEQRSRPNCYGAVSEDCDGDYREALSRMTGEAKGGHQEQVTALEAKEKARLAAEKAERERLEAERRARELAERQEAERRAMELAERRRIEAERERKRARLAAERERRRARRAREAEEQREFEMMAEMEAREQAENLIEIFAGMAQGVAGFYSSKAQQEMQHKQRVAEQRRRQAEIAWQRQQEQEREWRLQQQRQEEERREARLRLEEEERRRRQEEERRRRQEEERRRREAERQRQEAERLAKETRRAACRSRISGARNGCVQVVKWHGVGAFGGTYTLRNNCSYPIKVWHGRKSHRLDNLMSIPSGATRKTAPTYGVPYHDGSMRHRRLAISYVACYADGGVSGSGGSCTLQSWACASVD